MEKFFSLYYKGQPLKVFSPHHRAALYVILGVIILLYIFRDKLREEPLKKTSRYTIGTLLLVQQLLYYAWHIYTGIWSLQESLPFNLCAVTIFLEIIMLFSERYDIFEIIYFFGLGGATQALITPDIQGYGFPHFRFFQFFIAHGLIVIIVFYMVFVYQYRPTIKSIIKTFKMLIAFGIIVAVVNLLTGGNYSYLCEKPPSPSLMDILGPWPWYILSLLGIATLTFIIVYLPFAIKDYIEKRKEVKKAKSKV
ncbi:TIGR02206 family membrane protein [Caldisalinibacter kiritimatiensis]|uniref:ABC transporter, permease protein, putative n=1 Tax=Caldisalinibacter kiritimatiensis TaxID=1304284 RepID=R1CFR0_9FIRM|nr:TIGR02206 family membrane protein [Caldisalinibacter kiritimatiensis]EOD01145.1 ABC transporter, permease protein, putative [Caldisalinibacter kiritimatiensis]